MRTSPKRLQPPESRPQIAVPKPGGLTTPSLRPSGLRLTASLVGRDALSLSAIRAPRSLMAIHRPRLPSMATHTTSPPDLPLRPHADRFGSRPALSSGSSSATRSGRSRLSALSLWGFRGPRAVRFAAAVPRGPHLGHFVLNEARALTVERHSSPHSRHRHQTFSDDHTPRSAASSSPFPIPVKLRNQIRTTIRDRDPPSVPEPSVAQRGAEL
jgi:hypothetical protein